MYGANEVCGAILLCVFLLTNSLIYVYRRRKGKAGPLMTPLFIKFWSVYGMMHFAVLVLSQYLTPFGLAWLVSVIRTLVLAVMTWGAYLPFATRIYDRILRPFYDAQEAEIEQYFSRIRSAWNEQKEALEELAQHLLNRVAIGGVDGVVSQAQGEKILAAENAEQVDPVTGRRRRSPSLPDTTTSAITERQFFAGQAEDRVHTAAGSSVNALRGVIRPAGHDVPKPAYEHSRALRQAFRQRAARNATPAPPAEEKTRTVGS